jgi:hypothetical protein
MLDNKIQSKSIKTQEAILRVKLKPIALIFIVNKHQSYVAFEMDKFCMHLKPILFPIDFVSSKNNVKYI